MKAIAVYPGKPNSMHLEEVPKPDLSEIPGGRGVLVRVLRVGVDGTDREINEAKYGQAPAGSDFLITGHENFGRVVAVGPNVPSAIAPGAYVVALVRRPGQSIYDQIGLQDMTTDDVYFERGINLRHGYLTEYYVEDAQYVVPLPPTLREVGVLLEPMTISQKGLNQAFEIQRRLKVWRPRRAAVIGAGTVSLLAALALRLRGLEVVAYSRRPAPYRNSDLIAEIGGHYVSSQETTLAEASAQYGPFDIMFEATGFSPLVFEAAEALGKNGVLILSSVTGGDTKVEVSADRINQGFVLGNKVMVGTVNASRADFESGVNDLVKAEALFPGWLRKLLTTEVRGLENYEEMLRHLANKDAIKVYVQVAPESADEPGERRRARRAPTSPASPANSPRMEASDMATQQPPQPTSAASDPERQRLAAARENGAPWLRWGPYLADRQWGTVREDYSSDGSAWDAFPHDHARSRAYRWGEDGLLGISDDQGILCFALALWNEADPILKERLFGLTGPEGNHGEDVKEYYYFLDSTPTHSYMKALYKYPQRAFPYADLVAENRRRGRGEPEYELLDTGIFAENRYFDITVEYAKAGPDDILIRVTAANRGPEPAPLHLLPTLWFRNTWVWGDDDRRPALRAVESPFALVRATHTDLGTNWLACEGRPDLLFTENETNAERLWGAPNRTPYVKDGIDDAVVHGARGSVASEPVGTKVAVHYSGTVAAGATTTVTLRLSAQRHTDPFANADALFRTRRVEADTFYAPLADPCVTEDARQVQRQAFAGLLWSKQLYSYDVARWLDGDPAGPPPPGERRFGRNANWRHLNNQDILSMPDAWEYPWFAAWDLAFHCIPLALVDPEFAKQQLTLLVREWYMHPDGQIPAYEWAFGDVNPPVHAWAAWRVYKIERRLTGRGDRAFLERIFHKLLLNFTWWVNRKDSDGHNVFQGGFLGLDNIGVFDRSAMLPTGGHIEQSDGTAWMGMYSLNMLAIALELARENPVYEDVATKFFEHFLSIASAMNNLGGDGVALWDEQDEFFYDVLHLPNGDLTPVRLRTLVGLIPLLAVETIEPDILEALPGFKVRLEWYLRNRPELAGLVSRWQETGMGERRLLALVRGHRMKRLLKRMLDPKEFLSDHGIRGISRAYAEQPFTLDVAGMEYVVRYEPGESSTGLFGGNSNWRGPVWFPINFLLIEALQKFHHYYGDDFLVECPMNSGEMRTLWQVAENLSCRLTHIFLRGPDGRRPVFGEHPTLQNDPHWRDHLQFYEYFHGESGAGVGASHQTGWTALVAKLLEQTRGR